jgi:hypothetical protein
MYIFTLFKMAANAYLHAPAVYTIMKDLLAKFTAHVPTHTHFLQGLKMKNVGVEKHPTKGPLWVSCPFFIF